MIMALCTACDRLARVLSTYCRILIRNIQHSEAANLLESAKNCRLCKFLISCVGETIYTSAEPSGISTVKEGLTLNSECRGRLTYTVGFATSQCDFQIHYETDEGNNAIRFRVIFWAEDGTSYLII
jgi:hypothetical protein